MNKNSKYQVNILGIISDTNKKALYTFANNTSEGYYTNELFTNQFKISIFLNELQDVSYLYELFTNIDTFKFTILNEE